MAVLFDKLKNMITPPEDEYEYEDENYTEENSNSYVKEEQSYEESDSSPSLFKRTSNKATPMPKSNLHVIVVKPKSFGEETRSIADSLIKKCAVVLNLERTPKEDSVRILDFLSGVAYSMNGKVQKIATATYIVAPYNVDLSGEEIFDEFEHNGVYF